MPIRLAQGLSSLARPGGNITGLSFMSPEITGKRLEILKETVPDLSRVAVLTAERSTTDSETARELQSAAKALALKLQIFQGRNPNEIDGALSKMTNERVGARGHNQSSLVRKP
jgi:putative ABC transport system substrate-binding protein